MTFYKGKTPTYINSPGDYRSNRSVICEDDDMLNQIKAVNEMIQENPKSVKLETDEGIVIAKGIRAYKEDDHMCIEFNAEEKYRQEIEKEGFIILD